MDDRQTSFVLLFPTPCTYQLKEQRIESALSTNDKLRDRVPIVPAIDGNDDISPSSVLRDGCSRCRPRRRHLQVPFRPSRHFDGSTSTGANLSLRYNFGRASTSPAASARGVDSSSSRVVNTRRGLSRSNRLFPRSLVTMLAFPLRYSLRWSFSTSKR